MAENSRLPRFHRNLVEQHLNTEFRKDVLHEVVLPHRDTAGYQQHIMFETTADLCTQVFQIVPGDTKQDRRRTGFSDLRLQMYSCCCFGSGLRPGVWSTSTSSSPVARMATLGFLETMTSLFPAVDSRPMIRQTNTPARFENASPFRASAPRRSNPSSFAHGSQNTNRCPPKAARCAPPSRQHPRPSEAARPS